MGRVENGIGLLNGPPVDTSASIAVTSGVVTCRQALERVVSISGATLSYCNYFLKTGTAFSSGASTSGSAVGGSVLSCSGTSASMGIDPEIGTESFASSLMTLAPQIGIGGFIS